MSKQDELVKIMEEFIKNTIYGHESGFYKVFCISPNILNSNALTGMIDLVSANYLNEAYKALIKENDDYFTKYFNGMASISNHSQICLLNIVFVSLMLVHKTMERDRFDIESYEKYMVSVENEIMRIIDKERNKIIASISHECNGQDIKNCDPNIDMFVIKPDENN